MDFFGQISLPFHKLQLVKYPPFYNYTGSLKLVPLFGWSLPVCAIKGSTSPPAILRLEQIEF